MLVSGAGGDGKGDRKWGGENGNGMGHWKRQNQRYTQKNKTAKKMISTKKIKAEQKNYKTAQQCTPHLDFSHFKNWKN